MNIKRFNAFLVIIIILLFLIIAYYSVNSMQFSYALGSIIGSSAIFLLFWYIVIKLFAIILRIPKENKILNKLLSNSFCLIIFILFQIIYIYSLFNS